MLGRPYDPAAWESEADYEADCRRTTLWRKVQEAVFAMAMEVAYTKDEILTIYLNRDYLGCGVRVDLKLPRSVTSAILWPRSPGRGCDCWPDAQGASTFAPRITWPGRRIGRAW